MFFILTGFREAIYSLDLVLKEVFIAIIFDVVPYSERKMQTSTYLKTSTYLLLIGFSVYTCNRTTSDKKLEYRNKKCEYRCIIRRYKCYCVYVYSDSCYCIFSHIRCAIFIHTHVDGDFLIIHGKIISELLPNFFSIFVQVCLMRGRWISFHHICDFSPDSQIQTFLYSTVKENLKKGT